MVVLPGVVAKRWNRKYSSRPRLVERMKEQAALRNALIDAVQGIGRRVHSVSPFKFGFPVRQSGLPDVVEFPDYARFNPLIQQKTVHRPVSCPTPKFA